MSVNPPELTSILGNENHGVSLVAIGANEIAHSSGIALSRLVGLKLSLTVDAVRHG